MKTIAILDVETTDVDPSKGHLLEVGCVLWSVEHRAIIEAHSWLYDHGLTENAAQAVNGISPGLLRLGGDVAEAANKRVSLLAMTVDACCAWNADFDRQWLPFLADRTWFDAMDDLEWPRASSSRKLVEVALAHGVGVVDAHRALTDCLTIARLLERVAEMLDSHHDDSGATFDAWLARALRPKVHVEVSDSRFNADMNAVYKEHGFRWAPAPAKRWRRKMFAEDARKLPFVVQEVRP